MDDHSSKHTDDDAEKRRMETWLQKGAERQYRQQMTQGTRLLQEHNAKEALPLLKRAYEIQPENADAALNLSTAYLMLGQAKLAVPVLEEATQHTTDNARLWINLGAAYLGNPVLASDEKQTNAINAFKRALQVDPFAPSAAYNIGLIHVDRDELEQAIAAFTLAAKSDAGDLDAKRMLKKLQGEESSSE